MQGASDFVEIFGPANLLRFFDPSQTPIASIVGDETSVRVTLLTGVVLEYKGNGLTFDGTLPTGGTITSVSLKDAAGASLATLTLSAAPWNFTEITTQIPFQSYLATPHAIQDAFSSEQLNSASLIVGGNLADEFGWSNGADTLLGNDGDDTFIASGFLGTTRPVGTIVNGGGGRDKVLLSSGAFDLRNVTFLGIETIELISSNLRISSAQLGNGKIELDAAIRGFAGSVLQIDQVAGSAVNVSNFQIDSPNPSNNLTIRIVGSATNDVQIGNDRTNDVLEGFDGNDTLNGGGGADRIFGGEGDDRLSAGGSGTGLTGSSGQTGDELYGGNGNDRLTGGSQQLGRGESLFGGSGDDTLIGGTVGSELDGGSGNDYLRAQSAATGITNFMSGGDGNDTLVGSSDRDIMLGGSGDDLYRVSSSLAEINEAAGGGIDRVVTTVDLNLSSRSFNSDAGEIERIEVGSTLGLNVTGSASNNVIVGNVGADSLSGDFGADRLIGGAGNDLLSGDQGADILIGGAGEDTFVFSTGFGRDRVDDFVDGSDVIDLRSLDAITSFDDLVANQLKQVGQNVWIEGDGLDTLILRNVSLSTLSSDDFLF
jgi:Ca2+-binding RTX toxin-like protein